MDPTARDSTDFGRRLNAKREASGMSFRAVEREVWLKLDDATPTSETLRRFHSGDVAPNKVAPEVLACLAEIYGCSVRGFGEYAALHVERAREILGRQHAAESRAKRRKAK